ncbi:MAG: hypothetical protein ACLFTK_06350 [Anaerolineales bacterium]
MQTSPQGPRNQTGSGTIIASVLMASIGWLGLFYLIQNVIPRAGARWVFFVLLYIAVAGSIIPVMKLVNRQLRGRYPDPPDWVSVRQGLWFGLYVTICAWLQIPRVLTPALAFFMALTLFVIEVFLRLRERNQHGY